MHAVPGSTTGVAITCIVIGGAVPKCARCVGTQGRWGGLTAMSTKAEDVAPLIARCMLDASFQVLVMNRVARSRSCRSIDGHGVDVCSAAGHGETRASWICVVAKCKSSLACSTSPSIYLHKQPKHSPYSTHSCIDPSHHCSRRNSPTGGIPRVYQITFRDGTTRHSRSIHGDFVSFPFRLPRPSTCPTLSTRLYSTFIIDSCRHT